MSPHQAQSTPRTHGEVLTAISERMVSLLKEFYGRGPTRAKTYFKDDLVVCLLRGGFSRVEQTLLEGGRGSSVIQQRMEFQDLMCERFEAAIEDATGPRVVGFMSGNQQDPDIMCESSSSRGPISSTTRSPAASGRSALDTRRSAVSAMRDDATGTRHAVGRRCRERHEPRPLWRRT